MKSFFIENAPMLCLIAAVGLFVYYSNKDRTFKLITSLLLILALVFLFTSCSPGKCYPSKKSKDYAVRSWWKQRSDGYWIHHREEGFKPATNYIFECKPSDQELARFYDSISKK